MNVTNNSPTTGSIAWSDCSIVYKGVKYAIADGNTAMKYVWWQFSADKTLFQSSDTLPHLEDNDVLVFVNNEGKHRTVIYTGIGEAGTPGTDGEDATVLRIDSSRGTVFKNNMVSTVLSAVIYHGSERITDKAGLNAVFGSSAYLEWAWQRMGQETFGVISANDARLSNDGFCFTISPADVDTKVTFTCSLITA